MLSKREHVQLAALDDHKNVEPTLGLGSLSSGFPVLLATQHALFRPWCTEQRELFVRDADRSRAGFVTLKTPIFVFLSFTYDRVGQVGRETEGRCEERSHGTVHTLE